MRKPESSIFGEVLRQIEDAISSGANTAGIRIVRKSISRRIADWDRDSVLRLAHHSIRLSSTGRFVAYELVESHAPVMSAITIAEVESLGAGMSSWAEVDTFSIYVAGPAWRASRISDSEIQRWAKSEDRWWRRAALVATVPLNSIARGGTGDGRRTLAICRMLLRDRDDMVVKALSWALRALGTRERAQVEQFLSDYRDNLAARVIREVNNKLTTGLKSAPARLR